MKISTILKATVASFSAVLLSLISGCATPIKPEESRSLGIKQIFEKNYIIGSKNIVNVGDPMVKLQDYWISTTELAVAIPSRSITVSGGPISTTMIGGNKYLIKGRYRIEDTEYLVVGDNGVLIRTDGSIHNRLAAEVPGKGYVTIIYTMNISDPTVTFTRDTEQRIDGLRGYKNFELLYTGKNASGINLTYREFSPEGIAKVAFFQNLTYEKSASTITFKNYKIVIHESSSDAITFTIISDGLSEK